MPKPDWFDPRAVDDAERAGLCDPPHPSEYEDDDEPVFDTVTIAVARKPGASHPREWDWSSLLDVAHDEVRVVS